MFVAKAANNRNLGLIIRRVAKDKFFARVDC